MDVDAIFGTFTSSGLLTICLALALLIFLVTLYTCRRIIGQDMTEDLLPLEPVPGTDGLFVQSNPPSTQPPGEYSLPCGRNFSGQNHRFVFSIWADVATDTLLSILDKYGIWAGVSEARFYKELQDEEKDFVEDVRRGLRSLQASGHLIVARTADKMPVYFMTPDLLECIALQKQSS